MQSPCNKPAFSKIFITNGIPPALCKSTVTYLPDGFRSQNTGVFFANAFKIFQIQIHFRFLAMAIKCKMALVEPPMAITTAMAFSKDSFHHNVARAQNRDGWISPTPLPKPRHCRFFQNPARPLWKTRASSCPSPQKRTTWYWP